MQRVRGALIGFLVFAYPTLTVAQPSATPLLDTNTNSSMPSIPMGGFSTNVGSVVDPASQNNAREVRNRLLDGASPNSRDRLGRTGLMYAAIFNNASIAKMLLDHDATVDPRDNLGDTALHWAAERGSIKVLRMLLAAHATVDAQNRQGVTPLMLAIANNHVEAVKLLLADHADPHKQDYTGRDAFGWVTDNNKIAQLLKETH